MRTIIDIPKADLNRLDRIAKQSRVSRAEVVRRAVSDFARRHETPPDVFGIWRDRAVDGLVMQEALRAEWEREWDR